jgi:cation transport protein ChaC
MQTGLLREDRMHNEMALTPELVARCERGIADPGPEPGLPYLSEAEYDLLTEKLLAQKPAGPLWVFAYGSLIWNPEYESVEHRRAGAHGWHRAFCLELQRWRGTPEQKGLMMALERGGSCHGVLFRLPDNDHGLQLGRLLRREISFAAEMSGIRWIPVDTAEGRLYALVFWAGATGLDITVDLPLPEVARILARACGHLGSGAGYLYNTVSHLKEYGIRDRNLWRLQELVAEEIKSLFEAKRESHRQS